MAAPAPAAGIPPYERVDADVARLLRELAEAARDPDRWRALLEPDARASSPVAAPHRHASELELRLRQALEHYASLAARQHLWAPAAGALDCLPFGLILVDHRGVPQHVNRFARGILESHDGLMLRNGTLEAERAVETMALRKAIAQTSGPAADPPPTVPAALTLPRRSGKRPLSVLVAAADAYGAALFVHDPEHSVKGDESVLCRIYGLTQSEAALTRLMLAGRSLEEAAEELGISIHTARTHVKRVFLKTDTSRQGQLIGMLLNGPALFSLT